MTPTRPPAEASVQPSSGPAQPGGPQLDGPQPGGIQPGGIQVRLAPGGYLLGVLAAALGALALPAATPGKPVLSYLAATAAGVVILLASLLAHELGHAIVIRHYRGRATATVGLFGGVSHGRSELPSPRAQGLAAAAGPAVSLLLASAGVAVLAALGGPGRSSTELPVTVALAAAWINGLLGVANLVPAAGLDGGRIVRALAWARSGDPTRAILISARFGQVTGAVLTAAGTTAVILHHMTGIWAALLGILMITASRAEAGPALTYAALAGLRVRDILPPAGQPVPAARGWQSVQSFLEGDSELGLVPAPPGITAFPVRDFDGQRHRPGHPEPAERGATRPPPGHPARPGGHPSGPAGHRHPRRAAGRPVHQAQPPPAQPGRRAHRRARAGHRGRRGCGRRAHPGRLRAGGPGGPSRPGPPDPRGRSQPGHVRRLRR